MKTEATVISQINFKETADFLAECFKNGDILEGTHTIENMVVAELVIIAVVRNVHTRKHDTRYWVSDIGLPFTGRMK